MALANVLRVVVSGTWNLVQVVVVVSVVGIIGAVLLVWVALRAIVGDSGYFWYRPPALDDEPEPYLEAFDTLTDRVLVMKIPRDGDSLFAALAHQVNFGHAELKYGASVMRKGAAAQMVCASERYHDLLLESAAVHEDRYRDLVSEECVILQYMHDLTRPGFPAGTASAQALADGLGVDVIVFVEEGTRYVLSSSVADKDAARPPVAVAQRLPLDGDKPGMIHYDSVVRAKDLY